MIRTAGFASDMAECSPPGATSAARRTRRRLTPKDYCATLPRVLPHSGALIILARMGMTAESAVNPRIAVVDDDDESREAVAVLVKSLGFAVETFSCGDDLLSWPRLRQTSCLIADVNMPGMSGVELHERLVMLGHAIPTILITAYPDDAVRDRAMANGVIAYLTKPCSDVVLFDLVRSALTAADGTS
jgi:CheY-like chemotaxis protein